jgi:Kef-type K+ transport system membrane component KefB
MSTTPQPARSNRRLAVVLAVLVVAALIVIGLVAAYMFFFGSEAPAAPTLDDALKVLLPSATPGNSG